MPEFALDRLAGVDHFDVYDGLPHEQLVADQLAFMRRHLLPGQAIPLPAGSSGGGKIRNKGRKGRLQC
jgi:hypothetical protein